MKQILLGLLLAAPLSAAAQALTPDVMQRITTANALTRQDVALRNALAANGIDAIATKAVNPANTDLYFSHEAPSKGITDQQSSGRCWLFTGLNVMRAKVIAKQGLGNFEFSQSFCSFYDQLEKANLFLQSIIDKAALPMDDKTVEWLFKNPLSDGGTFTGVQDIVSKYGVVPAEVMPESYNANNTSKMASIISLKLRQWGLELRKMVAGGAKSNAVQKRKEEMLGEVYHILALCLGTPPAEFDYQWKDASGKPLGEKKHYTPLSFYKETVGWDLQNNYVLLMNDPTRPYHQTYTIDLDRHTYDGHDWTYINLPMDEIKKMAVASIADSTRMYFSCDVGKFLNRKTGILSLDNYDYESVFGTTFPMTKAERIQTFASASSHAMTLCAVDIDADGNTRKWKVENSWGPTYGVQGHLVMTDEWFDEYMFRLVVERRFVPEETLKLLNLKPVKLPAWDPLFTPEN